MKSRERCLIQPQQHGEYGTYAFVPSLFHLVPTRIRGDFSAMEQGKLLLRLVRGYYVYYQVDEEQKLVSYCFLKRNYLHKYAFLSPPANKYTNPKPKREKLLINPYYVASQFRGKGLGGKLIRTAIDDGETDWCELYAVVKADNLASIRTLEKLGFQKAGYSEKRGWSHRLTDKKTHLHVFFLVREKTR